MMIKKLKDRECEYKPCNNTFTPIRVSHIACSPECAYQLFLIKKHKQQNKEWKIKKKVLKEKLKTHGDFENDLQAEINKIARMIDIGTNCISCNGTGKPQGGHYHSVGSNCTIRFNLHNIHIQDYYCNHELSGNIIGYNKGLIERYGIEYKEYVELELPKIPIIKLAIFELKEKIAIARRIIKDLEDNPYPYDPCSRIEIRKQINERIGIYPIIQ